MANEDKATRYHRLRRRTALASGVTTAILLLLFLISGSAAALRSALDGLPAIPGVLAYTLLLALGLEVAAVPFAFYQGVLLERRYGLSRESTAHWWVDWLKGSVLSACLASGAGTTAWVCLRLAPESWWLWTAALLAAALVGLAQIAPVVILPLFSRYRPLDRPDLATRLLALAERAGTRVLGVFEWQLGDRTRKANAALAGLGATRRILLSDTLLAEHADDEIEVILAHELSHHVHGDIWMGLLAQGGSLLAACYAADAALAGIVGRFGVSAKDDPAVLPALLLTGGIAAVALLPVVSALSRAHERRADTYALTLTRNAPAFVRAMKRLAQQNLAEDRPASRVAALFQTHPPIAERIDRALEWDARQNGAAARTVR